MAYPAKYATSGVMTFIVNHDGVVYQKDLGRRTEKGGPGDEALRSGQHVEESGIGLY